MMVVVVVVRIVFLILQAIPIKFLNCMGIAMNDYCTAGGARITILITISIALMLSIKIHVIAFKTRRFVVYRGFGFVTFADPSSVDKVLAQGSHELDGKKVSKRFLFLFLLILH